MENVWIQKIKLLVVLIKLMTRTQRSRKSSKNTNLDMPISQPVSIGTASLKKMVTFDRKKIYRCFWSP